MTPPPHVVTAFGGDTDAGPVELSGGMAPAYRVGGVVLKRAGEPAEARYAAEVMAALTVDEARVRVARPVAARHGGWIVDGWSATAFVDGQRPGRSGQPWAQALDAADALHDALRGVPYEPALATRTHRWAIAERVAWDEETIELDPRIEVLRDRLRRFPAAAPGGEQLVHGDLCGNLLFHPELPPAIIDFSPMWRSPGFTRAIYVADALGWHGGDDDLYDAIAGQADTLACLSRAGVFRLVALHGRILDLGIDLEPLLPEYTAMIDRLVGFLDRAGTAVLQAQIDFYRTQAAVYPEDPSAEDDAVLARCAGATHCLELASGTGRWTRPLLRVCDRVTAVDASPEMHARNRARTGEARVDYVVADLFAYQPPGGHDLIFAGSWLSHVPPERFAEHWVMLARALRPGGRVVMVDDGVMAADGTSSFASDPSGSGPQRRTIDGRDVTIVKVAYGPEELEARLAELGWSSTVTLLSPVSWLLEARRSPTTT